MRKKFIELSKAELSSNKGSYLLLGDISVGGFIQPNGELFNNVINMGIAEQGLISFAAGLSEKGANIIVHTISPFLVERAYEQIKLFCGYNNARLILVSANGPFDYEKLGPTHHCAADVSILAHIDNLNIFTPSTILDFTECFESALKSNNSSYIRLTSRVARVDQFLRLDSQWRYVCFADGVMSKHAEVNPIRTYICVGESLEYVLKNKISSDSVDVFWTINPISTIPINKIRTKDIIILEPYAKSAHTLQINSVNHQIKRLNFSNIPKRVISSFLGWEDFDDCP